MSQLGLTMDEDGRQRKRRRRGRGKAFLAVTLSLAVVAGLLVGVFLGGRAVLRDVFSPAEDYPGPGTGEVTVDVAPGDSIRTIGATLADADVVASQQAFVAAAEEQPAARGIQPGTYAMRRQMSAAAAVELLLDPAARVLERVTVPEGVRLERTLELLAEGTGLPPEDFEAAVDNAAYLGLPDYAGNEPEGFLFPATYEVEADTSAGDVLRAMTARFRQAAADLDLERGATEIGYAPREVVTVASLVEAEASRPEDQARVARVIYNRLEQDMPLQLDSTVNYATGKTGITTTPEDRASDSPYNTYGVRGLPPGPINSPGEAALRAALAPEPGAWRYFVTVDPDTGETRFAVTAGQHAANVEQFRAWLRQQD